MHRFEATTIRANKGALMAGALAVVLFALAGTAAAMPGLMEPIAGGLGLALMLAFAVGYAWVLRPVPVVLEVQGSQLVATADAAARSPWTVHRWGLGFSRGSAW